MKNAVITKNLTKKFKDIIAVRNLNLKVRVGEIFGLLGPNGAGKTTTIRMICGLLKPTRGKVMVFGYEMPKDRAEASKVIGYMTQHTSLYDDLTVKENLEFYASLYRVRKSVREKRVKEILKKFLLWDVRNKLVGKLSGGTKQRVALAASLVHNPKLLILDEPTAGVDPRLRRNFWNYFKKLNSEGITILITTHYMDEAEFCDRLGLMHLGRLIAIGKPEEIKRKAAGGEIVELEVLNGTKALNIISSMPEVKNVDIISVNKETTTLRILMNNAGTGLPDIIKELELSGFKIRNVKHVSISLEDAFLSLMGD